MKFSIIALALLGVVAADVKHLSNMYLPPHIGNFNHKSVEYAQQSQEIPQASLSFGGPVEITDNSVTAQVENQEQAVEQQYFTSNKIDNLNYGAGSIQSNTEENKYYAGAIAVPHPEIPTAQVESEEKKYFTGLMYKSGQEDSATTTTAINAETSVPAPGSDAFTQQQAAYYTSINQQQEAVAPVAEGSIEAFVPAPGSDTFTQQQAAYFSGLTAPGQRGSSASTSSSTISHVEQVSQEPERQYYSGMIAPSQGDSSASTSTSTIKQVEQVSQEPERQYYTGMIAPSQGDSSGSTSTSTITHVKQVPQDSEGKYYTGLNAATQGSSASLFTATAINAETSVPAPAPGSEHFTQQQAAYFTQQSPEGLAYNNGQAAGGTTTTVVQPQSLQPQQNYNTGLNYNPGQESGHSTTVVEQQRISVPAPGADAFTQQQAAYSVGQQQESAASALGSTSGIDTQYAANGGYVY